MAPEDSTVPSDWLPIVEKDLDRVARMLEDHDPEAAGFYLQQALEKLLKAFLLSKGWELDRVHDLESLLNDAIEHDPSLEKFRTPCQTITAFYFVERYPLLPPVDITEADVRGTLEQTRELIETLRRELAGEAPA